jgi:hypothetical protein
VNQLEGHQTPPQVPTSPPPSHPTLQRPQPQASGPNPLPKPTPTHQSTHINQSANQSYVNIGAVTTGSAINPINTNNPFSRDVSSSRRFQQLSTPNEENFRNRILQSIKVANSLAGANHNKQTSGETGETLVSKMLITGESIASPNYLRCRSVKAVDPNTIADLGSGQIGVRALVTTNRLLLVDSNKNTVHKMTTSRAPTTFLSPPRPGESFTVSSTIADDVWFKPIPLTCVTGIEILSSHKSEASKLVSNNRHPIWFAMLSVGLVLLLVGTIDTRTISWSFSIGIFAIIVSIIAYSQVAISKAYKPKSVVYKERKISIGYFDTVANRPLILELELEDGQNLSIAYEWCRVLQQYSPQLSSSATPLVFNPRG